MRFLFGKLQNRKVGGGGGGNLGTQKLAICSSLSALRNLSVENCHKWCFGEES